MLKPKSELTAQQRVLADNFSEALHKAGVTAKAVAEACEISEQAVSNWKRTGKIARQHLPTIAAMTGWSVEELLTNKISMRLAVGPRGAGNPTIGTTILDLGSHLAALSPLLRASIFPLIVKVAEDPDLAPDAARTADAIVRSQ